VNVGRAFTRYHGDLVRYLTRLCGDSDTASDAAQEAFIRLAERPPRDENVRAWLFQVGTNLVRDGSRVRTRRLELIRETPRETLTGHQPRRPDDAAEAEERRRLVRTALDRLSERDRTVLLLREEGFTHREIAEAVDSTTKSIGTIIARALKKLANEITLDPDELG